METPPRMDRRTALKWMLSAASAAAAAPHVSFAAGSANSPAPKPTGGVPTDPVLTRDYAPGELWPLTLTDEQRRTATVLSDVILPADDTSPAASAVGVVDFIDEWISAPYAKHAMDRGFVLGALDWVDDQAMRRFARYFAELNAEQHAGICDDICSEKGAAPDDLNAARCFAKFRDLVTGGYYTTAAGRKAIGYIGNLPSATFDGPPPEALRHVGLL